jgi:branched-chain amino acid transport system permease protein
MSLVVYGAIVGCLYGLWSTSFSLIYRATRIFHVVHAAVFTLSGYIYWLVGGSAGPIAGLACSLVAGVALGAGSELCLYRPLLRRGATPVLLFVVSLGAYLAIENMILLIWGAESRIISPPLEEFSKTFVQVIGAGLSLFELAEAVLAVLLWAGILALLQWTLTGKAMRAIATAPEMAELAGIDVARIRLVIMAVGSLLIALSGIATTMRSGIEPSSGLPVWIIAVICTLISRADPVQSFLAGLLLGLSEATILLWIPTTWQPGVPVFILLLYLIGSSIRRLVSIGVARRNALRSIAGADLRL